MKSEDFLLKPRRVRVKSDPAIEFMISAVKQKDFGFIGIKAYPVDKIRPAYNEHLLISAQFRENWFEELEFADLTKKFKGRKFVEFND